MTHDKNAAQVHSGGYNFVSWNVKGLGHVVKRAKVFSHLKSLGADIIFLQETHIKHTSKGKLKVGWVDQLYEANFSTKARGVAILIRKNIPFIKSSVISDPNGRFVIVVGTLNSVPITLVNLYAPNFDNPDFFQKVFNMVPDYINTSVLVGGDYNSVLDPLLDKQFSKSLQKSNSCIRLNTLMENLNLVDIWRLTHPTVRDYSFFSSVHKVYSRIDYFLVDSKLLSAAVSATYHPIVISDHAPISMVLKVGSVRATRRQWRFDATLLKDKQFTDFLQNQISLFIVENDTGDVNDKTLWEALKAVIRGHIIAYVSRQKRAEAMRLEDLLKDLSIQEGLYKTTPKESTLEKITRLKYEYNTILSQRVRALLARTQQNYFELGDKPHRLLARQLRHTQATRAIHKINDKKGKLITDPQKINKAFASFYEELYQSKVGSSDLQKMNEFLEKSQLPKLDDEACESIEAPITTEEIKSAISQFPNNKAPGPDGFTIEIYKKYSSSLTPLLLRMFAHSKETAVLPPSLYNANITLIPKKDRDPLDMASYRPISLLQMETKILSKVLANRLRKHIASLIHPDQTGFVPGRQIYFNLRRLFNIIYSKQKEESVVIALDAEKAFDYLEREYMFTTLKYFNFGPEFIRWIEIIYAHPRASIITNGDISETFPLHRGVRQGCSCSPYLFNLALEALASQIRAKQEIAPIDILGVKNKISLFADDITLFISHPKSSIPPLLQLIDTFGSFSGYKINWNKSELMPISNKVDHNFLSTTAFKIATDKFKSLGIIVTRDKQKLLSSNWESKLQQFKQNIQFWNTLPISMVGRINAIKMVVLPRFLYIFQNLPVFIPLYFFKKLDSIISSFIWNNKLPRISKRHLEKPKPEGGFSLPHFKFYYWAANLNVLLHWRSALPGTHSNQEDAPSWLQMEVLSCGPTSLPALLNNPPKVKIPSYIKSPIIIQSLKVWKQIQHFLDLPKVYLDSPICHNHAFTPALMDPVFSKWRTNNILCIQDLYSQGCLVSFQHLQQVFDLPASHFFRFLQIRNFIRTHIPQYEQKPQHTTLDSIIRLTPGNRGTVSILYGILGAHQKVNTDKVKNSWEQELGMELCPSVWEGVLDMIHGTSVNSRHSLLQFKVVHRLHFSKARLHSIYPNTSPLCDKCKQQTGTLTHQFWACPKLSLFWTLIFDYISKAFHKTIVPDPLLAIFGCVEYNVNISGYIGQAISLCTLLAKRLILQHWKSEASPQFQQWLRDLGSVLHLERLHYSNTGRERAFSKTWQPLLDKWSETQATDS